MSSRVNAVVLAMFLSFVQANCSYLTQCEDSVTRQSASPDGRSKAVLLVRNCGATSDYSTIVKVLSKSDSDDDGDEVFIVKGDPEIRLSWQGDSELKITCDVCSTEQIFKRIFSLQGVSINY